MSVVEQEWLVEEKTPSGIEVRYGVKPKRCYEIRSPERPDGSHNFDWHEVPSVTTVLGVLDKSGPLIWWAQGIGGIGALRLQQAGVSLGQVRTLLDAGADDDARKAICDLLTQQKISTNHMRDKAADRGTAVHDAFESWAKTGVLPDPSIYPPTEEGYVLGLNEFIKTVNPEPLATEVLVASLDYGYAGRYDIRLRIPEACDVVAHRTPVKGPQYKRLSPGVLLADLKTSKGTYPSHALQLEAYEQASIESGYEPTEARGVLHVTADGDYAFKRVRADISDFLSVLEVWKRFQHSKEWL